MKIRLKILLLLNINFMLVQTAYSATLDHLVEECRVETFCDALATAQPGDNAKEVARSNSCFKHKVHACFSASLRGGIWWRGNDLDLSQIIVHGNFCGWRNLAKNADGSQPNWKNEKEILAAIDRTPAIDEVDEICKWHDIQYFTPPYAICAADRIFIKKMEALVWDKQDLLPANYRELALALSGAIEKNSNTCKEISWMKRNHIWN